jgi:hypothetical protein
VSPDSENGRLVRLEERSREHTEQLKQLWPLPAQYAVAEERHTNLRQDLNEGLAALREEIVEIKKANSERAKERRTMLIALFVSGVGLFGTFVATAVPLLKGPPQPTPQERVK